MRGPALVVLAAGASRRLGQPKALARLAGGPADTPLARLLAAGAGLGDETPLVIGGAHHEALAAAAPAGVELVRNPDWEEGRTGSVQVARRARPGRDLCLAPVDVPLVPGEVFEALREAWSAAGAPPRGWLAPFVQPRPQGPPRFGHPIVLGRELALDLEGLSRSTPLRVLRERARPLLAVAVSSPAILDDLDTPSDLALLRRRLDGEG